MTITISLNDELEQFVSRKISAGEFASADELVRVAVELLRQQDGSDPATSARLKRAWDEGMASGDFAVLDLASLKDEARRRRPSKT